MFGFKKDKERERYYLFPGMGGRAARRKQKMMLQWAIIAGTLVSIALATILYFIHRGSK